MHPFYESGYYGPGFGHGGTFLALPWLLLVLVLWTLFWKAWALWLAARRGEKVWFGALLVINMLGILEVIYIFLVAKRSDKPEKTHQHE